MASTAPLRSAVDPGHRRVQVTFVLEEVQMPPDAFPRVIAPLGFTAFGVNKAAAWGEIQVISKRPASGSSATSITCHGVPANPNARPKISFSFMARIYPLSTLGETLKET